MFTVQKKSEQLNQDISVKATVIFIDLLVLHIVDMKQFFL